MAVTAMHKPVKRMKTAGHAAGKTEKRHSNGNDNVVGMLEEELVRVNKQKQYGMTLRNTVFVLVVVAAFAVLVANLWMPVLRIYGQSMTPTLDEGDIVLSFKGGSFETGDLISFYYGNRLLVKRVIAGPGEWVDIAQDGTVLVNGKAVDEPYISEKAYGDVSVSLPYQVPDGRYFILGDHRATSADSRNVAIGCIPGEEIVGRIVFCVWPLNRFGGV